MGHEQARASEPVVTSRSTAPLKSKEVSPPGRPTTRRSVWAPEGSSVVRIEGDAGSGKTCAPTRGSWTTWLPAVLPHDTVRNRVTVPPPNGSFLL